MSLSSSRNQYALLTGKHGGQKSNYFEGMMWKDFMIFLLVLCMMAVSFYGGQYSVHVTHGHSIRRELALHCAESSY